MKYDIARCERQLAIKGWTASSLSEKCGVSQPVVSKFFAGKTLRNDSAKKIITTLGLKMEEIVSAGRMK